MKQLELDFLEQGGPMLWVLLGVSVFGFIVFLERVLFLHRGQIRTGNFLEGIRNLLAKERRLEALTLCEDMPGPVPGVVKAILLRVDESEQVMRRAAEEAALVEIPMLERRVGAIAAVARIAPLLGLLGTLLGILEAFYRSGGEAVLAYPNFSQFLSGLAEALITTVLGIIIAVMAQVAHHFLYGRVRALVHDMEYSGHELIRFLQETELPRQEEDSE